MNGGTCFNSNCYCTDQYLGLHCEIAFQCKTNDDCLNKGKCESGTCRCALGYVGANCGSTFSCKTLNPCFAENTDVNGFYFEQPDPNKYIQCNNVGTCYDKHCGQGLVWKQAAKAGGCGYP
ncbi:hypothetical protein NP493_1014g01002 [Ridgeia piscesae]|uniref:EGF-like domain-containing protein n=1 Tax=Ridgeia piscesae TaxID=27915 RepID=A0AAD9KIR7_RIDPI|nr:hypothetical protein NP493_1014g01002 [Ridgeia piscesae]